MVRAIAAVLLGTGVWMLAGLWPSYIHLGSALRVAAGSAQGGMAVLLAMQLLTPVLKFLAGLGILARNRWSWPGARAALLMDVIVLGASILRLHRFVGVAPPVPPTAAIGGIGVQQSSAIPLYVIGLLSLVCLVLMNTQAARRRWTRHRVSLS